MTGQVPTYLREHEALYARDPHQAALAWFQEAKFGLFLHYGVYSLLGRGEWVMFHEKIHVAEYEKLKDRFTAERFDAEFIADLALAAGMKYVNITTRHHDSFCLFETKQTDFNSVQSPARRDLIAELAGACDKRGLALFLYYSYGADWRHPYFVSREDNASFARPAYEDPEPAYLYREPEDFRHYVDFVHAQLRELLTQYGPVAGIWFDPIMPVYFRPDLFPVDETYALVRSLQPQCLISFKTGASGEEDFASPERSAESLAERLAKAGAPEASVELARRVWEKHSHNPRNEICDTLTNKHWGYAAGPDIEHRTADDVIQMLERAEAARSNLLLNTGPLPDGSIDPTDEATLREVGRRRKGVDG